MKDFNSETIEDRCKAEWSQSAELRTEFSTLERYRAYVKAAEKGQARIFGREETYGPGSRRKRARPEGPTASALIQRWKGSPELRREFRDNFSRFAAYEAARIRGATSAPA